MKSFEPQDSDKSLPSEAEERPSLHDEKKGGFITSVFILGTLAALTLASGGWYSNLIVYLLKEFNIPNIEAAQINNVVSGGFSFFPIVGAIFADSLLGSYLVIAISCFISLLGVVMFILTATIPSLRPPPCDSGLGICKGPTGFQYGYLYVALALGSIGIGSMRFAVGSFGADQLNKTKDQKTFFDWFVLAFYASFSVSYIFLVYIEDNVSWTLGFGLSVAANVVGIVLFLGGTRFYRRVKPQGSPFISMARILVASIKNIKRVAPHYFYENPAVKMVEGEPSASLRFLNRAAVIKEEDVQMPDASKKSWSLCSVEEVEDFKKVIKVLPLCSTGIFLSTPIAVNQSVIVLQALVMDRHLGPHFQIPAGTFVVFTYMFTAMAIVILDRVLYPTWQKLTGRPLRLLQRIGVGHVITMLGMICFGLVEMKRMEIVRSLNLKEQPNAVAPMSALWLILPLGVLGIGEACFFSAEMAFFYQEFPKSFRTTSTAMVSLHIALGYYMGTVVVGVVHKATSWLPNNTNDGRIDYVYWMLALIGFINFGYYLLCSTIYKCTHEDSDDEA